MEISWACVFKPHSCSSPRQSLTWFLSLEFPFLDIPHEWNQMLCGSFCPSLSFGITFLRFIPLPFYWRIVFHLWMYLILLTNHQLMNIWITSRFGLLWKVLLLTFAYISLCGDMLSFLQWAFPASLAARVQALSCDQHCTKHSIYIFPFNPQNNDLCSALFLCPFYRWANWGTKRLSDYHWETSEPKFESRQPAIIRGYALNCLSALRSGWICTLSSVVIACILF